MNRSQPAQIIYRFIWKYWKLFRIYLTTAKQQTSSLKKIEKNAKM